MRPQKVNCAAKRKRISIQVWVGLPGEKTVIVRWELDLMVNEIEEEEKMALIGKEIKVYRLLGSGEMNSRELIYLTLLKL